MQTQELLEVAGLVAANAGSLTREQPTLCERAITEYWVASRCRFDSWGHDLRAYATAARKSDQRPLTDRLYRLAVEIECSEVLARTIAAVGLAHDTQHGLYEAGPVAANLLAGYRDVAVRLNAVLASRDETAFREVGRLRELRRQLHDLTDHLVACFLPFAPATPYAHDQQKAIELGAAAGSRAVRDGEPGDWPELRRRLAELRSECAAAGPNAEQNHLVASAVMGLFGPEMFDSFGLLRSTWLRRLERLEGETSVLMDQWLATEEPVTPPTANRLSRSE